MIRPPGDADAVDDPAGRDPAESLLDDLKGERAMKAHVTMQLVDSAVKFTPDGKVAVVDAIKALSASKEAPKIWQSLKQNQPEFEELCERYDFQEDQPEPVVNSEGWEQIEDALLDYIIAQESAA
jgi:hypothetical protein